LAIRYRPSAFVALAGTRKPSEKGLEVVLRVSKVLARYPQITVVSGLAEGIDDHAHSLTLEHGLRNIAFLGPGPPNYGETTRTDRPARDRRA
jgi:predicted Rossmann fold nucleotide-binding protein DprA/Smf involved in DNA uptake